MKHSSFKLLFTAGTVSGSVGLGIYSLTQGAFVLGSFCIAAAVFAFSLSLLVLLADG